MGTLVLITLMTHWDSFTLEGFPFTSCLAMRQEVKGNLPHGTQMTKKKDGVLTLIYSIQNGIKKACL